VDLDAAAVRPYQMLDDDNLASQPVVCCDR
jgi:hypothetical protein